MVFSDLVCLSSPNALGAVQLVYVNKPSDPRPPPPLHQKAKSKPYSDSYSSFVGPFVKSSHLYLYSALHNPDCQG